jgi:WbqC-like protein
MSAPSTGKRLAIVQSNYIPWKGYFDLINMVDEFVLLDEVQYTRRDWRNRNKIKTPQGVQWLTIPVEVKGRYHQRIDETRIAEPTWGQTHWKTLLQNYTPAAHFERYRERLDALYASSGAELLSVVNRRFIETICDVLGITTKLSWSTDYEAAQGKTDRLLSICLQAGATEYVSGPAAAGYLDTETMHEQGIEVIWMNYSDYPEYPQLHGLFEHGLSILDLIFNEGPNAPRFMRSFGKSESEADQ